MHGGTRCGKFCCSFVPRTSKAGRDPPLDRGSLLHQAVLQEDRLLPLHRLSPSGLIKPLLLELPDTRSRIQRHQPPRSLLSPPFPPVQTSLGITTASCTTQYVWPQMDNLFFFPLVPQIPVSIPEKKGCLGTQMTAPRILNEINWLVLEIMALFTSSSLAKALCCTVIHNKNSLKCWHN